MLTRQSNPTEWALLLYELDDAREHLDVLLEALSKNGAISEEELRIDLGHVYAHLNRAWNGRAMQGEQSDDIRAENSKFPEDIEPVG